MAVQKGYRKTLVFITTLFFLWGFVAVFTDALVPRLKDVFGLTYLEASMVRFAFFITYLLFSIPATFILNKIGYRYSIVVGLLTMATGCFIVYPAASERIFFLFLVAIFVLASGVTLLQSVANQYVSTQDKDVLASGKLNVSQAFNALGTTIAPIVGAIYILSDRVMMPDEIGMLSSFEQSVYFTTETTVVVLPFTVIAIVLLLLTIVFLFAKFPKMGGEKQLFRWKEYVTVLNKQSLLFGAIAIFLYVGAEVAIGSFLVNYFIETNIIKHVFESNFIGSAIVNFGKFLGRNLIEDDSKTIAGIFVTFYWGGAMIGRFAGVFLSKIIAPAKLLILFSLGAMISILISINTDGLTSMWSILAVGFFNSIMFPSIFALTLDGLEDFKTETSGILCTMIGGGAIIPLVFGFFIDHIGFRMAFLSLVACYGFILFFGYYKRFIRF
ncbi:sugar MFS transporter [Capnocytophaga sp.]|uniref:sugar MFS transporter n=1 Tax=Capnocytophaga sp. TaxID=44737 RepID=UPI0026DB3E78|nr:sugar MFS transporter [Capnocytophaga sp.]MDO5104653.1 sugar MFS transporter [Capnocytophaga sp.]